MPLKYFFLLFLVTIGFSYSNSQICDPCQCIYPATNKLQITCSNGASNIITLPDPNVYTQLKSITSIVIQNATLIDYPQNVCLYSASLTSLDLSTNKISAPLPQSLLSCLTNLQYFFLYNNLVTSIEANAFSSNVNLLAVDLSRNRLTSIPSTLFPSTLTKLNYIDLRINNITSLDAWFFSLPSLNKLYLSSNNIRSFANTVGFSLANYNSAPSLLTNLNVIDLTNNPITAFDDSILSLYGVCDSTHFQYLIQLLYPMILSTTPLNCDCLGSYNLLTFTSALTNISLNSNLFLYGVCVTPTTYAGKSIFSFATPSVSCPTGVPFSSTSCSSVTTTTAANSNNGGEALIGAPDIPLASEYQSGLYAPEIAGIVLGLLGFLVLFLILLYCICPIEILACCFTCIPFFYTMCPCKSGVKRDKEYDLFISYNRSNTKWVKNKLIPFIHERCLVENFILHYNSENKEQEVFGPYIKDIMSRSSCILFVLSDAFLMKEWNNRDFQLHLRYLVTRERTRFICVQLHDVCDEEVDEYFVDKLQIPQFVSLEDDEFMFWTKLGYHLYTNDSEERVLPVVSSSKYYADDDDRPNDDIDFDRYNINRPIIHLPRQVDPESRNKPAVDERSRGRRALDTFRTTFMGHSSKNTKANKEQYVAATRQISFEQGRRPSKVEVNLDERWRILDSDHEKEYGMTNVAFRSEEETMTSGLPRIDTKALSAKRSRRVNGDDGYSIRKTDNNLEITMPVAHDVYMSHQVQNKIIRTSSSGYYNTQQNWNDSESAI